MKILVFIALWLFIAIGSKFVWYHFKNKTITYQYILIDGIFILSLFLYVVSLFTSLLDVLFSESINQLFQLLLVLLFFLWLLLISIIYWYFYKKYLLQKNSYFALEVFILFLVIPIIFIDLLSLIVNQFR